MDGRKLPSPVITVFALALVALVLDASGGPGWGATSAHVVLATRFEHLASSPLYDLLAGTFALLPVGEPGFRLGLLGALLGACTLAGVVAAARALLPRDPVSWVVAALLLFLAPSFREAAATGTPALLAAAGATWAFALALRFARGRGARGDEVRDGEAREDNARDDNGRDDEARRDDGRDDGARDARDAAGALAACALVVGSAPWLGALLAMAIVLWLARAGARRDLLAVCVGALGLAIVVLWLGAVGSLPDLHAPAIAAVAANGRGAGAIVVGAGLLAAGFAAATGLPHARWLAVVIVLAGVHEAVVGGTGAALLALLAIASAIIPSAIVRVVGPGASQRARHAIAAAAGLPLVVVALLTGATLAHEDPGDTPARLAHDLVDAIPPGQGIFVATRSTTWLAVQHEMTVAGARPDLALVPPLPANEADAVVANALRSDRVVGSDAAAFGRLDIRRAIPRGRGFQLVGEIPPPPSTVPPPADYPTPTGREQAILLALERARHEAASGRLDGAARAAGLAERFGAADLAVLGSTVPSNERPALFGFLPIEHEPAGPWLLDVFGDDLAWVGGLELPPLPPDAPPARRLHAKWREILLGTTTPDDPEIAALGPDAVRATKELFKPIPSHEPEAGSAALATDAGTDAPNAAPTAGSAAE